MEAVLKDKSIAHQRKACMAPLPRTGCFQGRAFGLTGELPRKSLMATLKSNGAQISAIIHKRVSFVVCTPDAVKYNTQKVRKAFKQDIPLVSQEFITACVSAKTVVDHKAFLATAITKHVGTLPVSDSKVDHVCTKNGNSKTGGKAAVGDETPLQDESGSGEVEEAVRAHPVNTDVAKIGQHSKLKPSKKRPRVRPGSSQEPLVVGAGEAPVENLSADDKVGADFVRAALRLDGAAVDNDAVVDQKKRKSRKSGGKRRDRDSVRKTPEK